MKITKTLGMMAVAVLSLYSCNDDNGTATQPVNENIKFADHSKEPAFVYAMPGFEDLSINTLISSSDVLSGTPNFVFAGQPDGMGIMKDPNSDGYLMITNHEITQSVSRVYLDKTFKPFKGESLSLIHI